MSQRNSALFTPNILASKSEEDPLPYCKTGAKPEGFNQQGQPESLPLVIICQNVPWNNTSFVKQYYNFYHEQA
jgi:hypothetical protein